MSGHYVCVALIPLCGQEREFNTTHVSTLRKMLIDEADNPCHRSVCLAPVYVLGSALLTACALLTLQSARMFTVDRKHLSISMASVSAVKLLVMYVLPTSTPP